VSELKPVFADSHTHLDLDEFAADREEVVQRAHDAGVVRLLLVAQADSGQGLDRGLRVARDLGLPASAGLHPHEAVHWTETLAARLSSLADSGSIRAIGEIGLDFHYDHSPRDTQREVFRRQIRLARDKRLPIVVHTREADEETIAILSQEHAGDVKGVIHCFTGGDRLADFALEIGFCVSFSGIACFPKAQNLRDIARRIPQDKVLIETDCPFLAPPPFRGQRNEPSRVAVVGSRMAEARGESAAELGAATVENFDRLFLSQGPVNT
jgi:TatD DNase family protein